MFDLLDEGLITAGFADGTRRSLDLPTVLSLLGGGQALSFPLLQPHQQHAWHAFLVQLAALALDEDGGAPSLELRPEDWRSLLLKVAGGEATAFSLVCSEPAKPAFFQSPVPEGSFAVLKNSSTTPEALDLLVTAKNHDVKSERIADSPAELFLFALVTLQTMEGFMGRGNYGIARMNGGFASRPCFAVVPDLDSATRFRRDVRLLLDRLVDRELFGFAPAGGHRLLWLLPWDGRESLPVASLHPFFLEICRRVRLVAGKSGIEALFVASEAPRVDAKGRNGRMGDLWTPVKLADQAALTVGEAGFNYRLLTALLLESEREWAPAPAAALPAGKQALVWAQVLVRGQGKTAGYHERLLPIPAASLGRKSVRDAAGALARTRIESVAAVQKRVLRPAICALLQGAPQDLKFNDPGARPHVDRLDREVDRIFFEQLFDDLDATEDENERDARWQRKLRDLAVTVYRDAVDSVPIPEVRRYQALAAADGLFHGGLRKQLPYAYPPPEASQEGEQE